ncbi:MAG: class I SAM-dependent methyltransferase [Polyangiaceae bacterium]|nr:class I SAM-dependent methyltransferase [Polyangiaceae bacterium]
MGLYADRVLPRMVDWVCGARFFTRQRQKVVTQARGVVLEVGIGGGRNLALYDPKRVSRVVAFDPNAEHLHQARRRAETVAFPVELRQMRGETAEIEPASIDTVVVTYTLCTIADAGAALRAVLDALKPDGQLLFCEHSISPDESVQKWQRRIEPFWKPLAGGCHLTRSAATLIQNNGFEIDTLEQAYAPGGPRWVGFHHIGTAHKTS